MLQVLPLLVLLPLLLLVLLPAARGLLAFSVRCLRVMSLCVYSFVSIPCIHKRMMLITVLRS